MSDVFLAHGIVHDVVQVHPHVGVRVGVEMGKVNSVIGVGMRVTEGDTPVVRASLIVGDVFPTSRPVFLSETDIYSLDYIILPKL